MTPRERFIAALERRPVPGRVPNFELVFFLTMEAFGRVHPSHRSYHQWDQMTEREREHHRQDEADIFIATAERFEHSAIYMHPNPGGDEETKRMVDILREKSGDTYFLIAGADSTYGIPSGSSMVEFAVRMKEDVAGLHSGAEDSLAKTMNYIENLHKHGEVDGFAMCADYCLNDGPFMSPAQFSEFVTPYLARLCQGMRDFGFYAIKHTDGNILPILDQMVQAGPHALHSLDPQGGVDIAEVKRLHGDELCLIGNVNCGMLDTGTDEEVVESVKYSLEHGMPGGGYIFSPSNCVYTGMELSRYELMLDVWRKDGNYPM